VDSTLRWAEEIFEMLAIQTYFAGLLVFYTTQVRESPRKKADSEVHYQEDNTLRMEI
jgi:hypothetical protein